jgi:hypothetical protein
VFVAFYWGYGEWWHSIAAFEAGSPAGEAELPAGGLKDLYPNANALYAAAVGGGLAEYVIVATPTPTPSPTEPTPTPTITPTDPPPSGRLWLPMTSNSD